MATTQNPPIKYVIIVPELDAETRAAALRTVERACPVDGALMADMLGLV